MRGGGSPLRAVAAWVLAASILTACGPAASHYRPGPVWQLPWDRADGVGRAVGRDGRTYGPQGCAAGSDWVALADSYRRRVLVRSAGGSVAVLPLPPAAGVAVTMTAAGAGLYVADDRASVWRLPLPGRPGAPRGSSIMARLAESGALVRIEGLGAMGGRVVADVISVGREEVRRELRLLPSGRTLVASAWRDGSRRGSLAPAGGPAIASGPGGLLLLLVHRPGDRHAVALLDAAGRERGAVELPDPGGHWSLAGADSRGFLYVVRDPGRPQATLLQLDRRGTRVWSLELPVPEGVPLLGAYACAAPSGTVWVMRPSGEALEVQAWLP